MFKKYFGKICKNSEFEALQLNTEAIKSPAFIFL